MSVFGTSRPPGKSLLFRSLSGADPTWRAPARLVESDPTETWAAQDFRSAKALFVPSLKRDIVPLLHGHDPPRGRVSWAIRIRRREVITPRCVARRPYGRSRRTRSRQGKLPTLGFFALEYRFGRRAKVISAFVQRLRELGLGRGSHAICDRSIAGPKDAPSAIRGDRGSVRPAQGRCHSHPRNSDRARGKAGDERSSRSCLRWRGIPWAAALLQVWPDQGATSPVCRSRRRSSRQAAPTLA